MMDLLGIFNIVPYFAITTEEVNVDSGEEHYHVGVINIGFSDWPMAREVWRSEIFSIKENAVRAAHDQFTDCMRTLFASRENGASV